MTAMHHSHSNTKHHNHTQKIATLTIQIETGARTMAYVRTKLLAALTYAFHISHAGLMGMMLHATTCQLKSRTHQQPCAHEQQTQCCAKCLVCDSRLDQCCMKTCHHCARDLQARVHEPEGSVSEARATSCPMYDMYASLRAITCQMPRRCTSDQHVQPETRQRIEHGGAKFWARFPCGPSVHVCLRLGPWSGP